jgi:hypothetical protein
MLNFTSLYECMIILMIGMCRIIRDRNKLKEVGVVVVSRETRMV